MPESVALGQGSTSSSSSAAPAPAAAAAAPAAPAAPALVPPPSPVQPQTTAPAADSRASDESGFKARLVRLDLLPDRQQDATPPPRAASVLPWENDASLHPA